MDLPQFYLGMLLIVLKQIEWSSAQGKWQLETPKILSICVMIDTNYTSGKMKSLEPIVVVTTELNNVCIWSWDKTECNDDFVLFVVEHVV